MTGASGRALWPASFRARFLFVVFFVAVVPLALIGVWLTRSVVRAGEDLLLSELDQSLQRVADGVELRWRFRIGELALLANNEVAQRLLSGTRPSGLTTTDSQYLDELVVNLARTIPSFEYRDAAGGVRWASPPPQADTVNTRGQRVARPVPRPTLTTRLPISGGRGSAPLGEVIAHVDLMALIAVDTTLRLPNGARLQVVQRSAGRSLLPAFAPDSLLERNRFTTNRVDWLAVHRSIADPPITLAMAAPLDAYVQPFERAARTGAITLAAVALLALTLSAVLTTRITSSIERLAAAADAVAGGDLNHRVDGNGAGEIGRLAAAFNSMTDSLRQTLSELTKRQALAAVGEYAASLAHQVRNGLTAVRVDLQRAQENTTHDTPGRPLVDRALENVKRLDATVTGSLRAARSSRTAHRRIDLRTVLRSATRMSEGAFAERGASCEGIGANGQAAWVRGDVVALEQLFLNLLLNAAQASPRDARAAIALFVNGSELQVLVTDMGGGIAPEDLEHVLDPFFSTKDDGTGLGLPIARQIATAHGGSLRIESVRGEGTRVEVRLPLAAAPAA